MPASPEGLPRRPGPSVRTRVVEHAEVGDRPEQRRREDRVVTEEPLELRLGWPGRSPERAWLTMRTPGHDFELAAGWARHEGILVDGNLDRVAYCTDRALTPEQEFNVVTLTLASAPPELPDHTHLHPGLANSACGVCGKESLERALAGPQASRWEGALPSPEVVRRLPDLLRSRQGLFDRTGGSHAAGLFTATGECLVVREDVGRHNAVDKVVGWALRERGMPLRGSVLQLSGRASFELVQKAAMAGIPLLSAVSAPSSLAVELAEEVGMTLVAFNRGRTLNVYSGLSRVLAPTG